MIRHRQGYTLQELVIAIALVGVVMLLLANFTSNSLALWRLTREQQNLQFKARTALRTITKEIREMQDAQNGSFAIATADPNEFIFYSNVDSDEDIERVRFFFDSNELRRGIIDPIGNPATYPVLNEVINTVVTDVYLSGDMFTYYDETYTGTEDPLSSPFDSSDVHLIRIFFLIDNDPTAIPDAIEMTTEITPRNLKQYAPDS